MRISFILSILLICLGCGASLKPIKPIGKLPMAPAAKPLVLSKIPEPINPGIRIRETNSLYAGMEDKTVALISVTMEKGEKVSYPYCAGVWVGADEILTAAHCVKVDNQPWVIPVGNEVFYVIKNEIDGDDMATYHHGKVISFDDAFDLVLIQATGTIPSHPVAEIGVELPAIGEVVYGVGHPSKLTWSFMSGEISAYRHRYDIGNIIQTNMSIWGGNSGGGLFDRDGRLIGICAQKTAIPGMGYYVRLDTIKRFLDEAHLKRSTGL